MSKQKFKNAYHSYRWMRRSATQCEALAWIGFYCNSTRRVIEQVIS